jgi:hypothetical protein
MGGGKMCGGTSANYAGLLISNDIITHIIPAILLFDGGLMGEDDNQARLVTGNFEFLFRFDVFDDHLVVNCIIKIHAAFLFVFV